jgi:predicted outer membrane repeat protein
MRLWWALAAGCAGKEEPQQPAGQADLDADGVLAAQDCDDQDETVYPGAEERCDGVDQDCDGEIDEDAVDAETFFEDADGDGAGLYGSPRALCESEPGWAEEGGDCDDQDPARSPDAPELCNGVDDDCNPTTAEVANIGGADFATVAEAIEAAVDGEVVTVCAGEHALTNVVVSADLTLVGVTGEPADVVLEASEPGVMITVEAGTLVLQDLTLSGAHNGEAYGYPVSGGAVTVELEDEADVIVRHSVFEDNETQYGASCIYGRVSSIEDSLFRRNSGYGVGCIYVGEGELAISGSTFEENEGSIAALNSWVPTTVTDSTFQGNDSAYGGAFDYKGEELVLSGVTFQDNQGSSGGALTISPNLGPVAVIADSATTFTGNTASVAGGAVYISAYQPGSWSGGSFVGNSSPEGGAIAITAQEGFEMSDVSVEGNQATSWGGGITVVVFSDSSEDVVTVRDSSLVGNSAPQGGGIAVASFSLPGADDRLELVDVVLEENTAGSRGGALYLHEGNQGTLSLQSCDLGSGTSDNSPDDLWLGVALSGYGEDTSLVCSPVNGVCE